MSTRHREQFADVGNGGELRFGEHRRNTISDVGSSSAYVQWYGKSRRQNWRTPAAFFEKLHAEFNFTLDGASEPGNGLLPLSSTAAAPVSWRGHRVFCNPPWSNIAPFLESAAVADLAVLLVPARANAKWFHRALALGARPRFFLGRIKFTGAKHNCPVDCCLLVFRRNST